jgi:exodeoxyribonuclease V beta subunit
VSAPAAVRPFDVCGDLPSGVTVLEASAGTGKTFAIAALAARYVAEGTPLASLLLVTFTRMATGELRERVRERLVSAEDGLTRALAGARPPAEDEVLTLLAAGEEGAVRARRDRLARALADFDAATIATTHGFCHEVLSGLGVGGDVERDAVLVEDLGDLLEEVVDDLYVRRFHRRGEAPFGRDVALAVGRAAVDNAFAELEPRGAPADTTPAMRRRLAVAVRDELERRKRLAGLLTYDDLLSRLRDTLADDERGPSACARLRERYAVALVDEFQDTDPVQWEIVRRAFGEGGATLVLIGDPKQAIYAFRGADVHAYLEAARAAATRATLDVNWRSDQGLIDAYDALFAGARLGHPGIAYRRVRAADGRAEPGLVGAPEPEALRVRVVRRADGRVALTPRGYANVDTTRRHVAEDLAADLVRLLGSGAEVLERRADGSVARRDQVRPGHVAVLVRTHRQAALVRDRLDAVGVPAVINGAGSVLGTETARAWLRLLEAIERPASRARAASAALTPFLGWSAERVAAAGERDWEEVHARLHRWVGVLRRRGVAALLETISAVERLPGRVLAREEGEREMTDLRHVGQLLHAAATEDGLGVTALAGWLAARIAEAAGADDEDRSRRLDSDAEAVQVLTVHRSKGLEFPVVYCPFLWDPGWVPSPRDAMPLYHDPGSGERTVDVGGPEDPGFEERHALYGEEQRGEDLRLAYVALTRARHRAVVWWAASWDSRQSPLARLLFFREPDGTVPVSGDAPPEDEEALGRLAGLAAEVPGCIGVEVTTGADGARWSGEPRPAAHLEAARFERTLDPRWRRTSYTAITAGAREAHVGSEPEEPPLGDEAPVIVPVAADAADGAEARLRAVASPFAELPAGAEFGTFVHGVLQRADPAAPDLPAELAARIAEERAWRPVDAGDPVALADGLRGVVETPLGPLLGERRLRDFGPADRLRELTFELPLVGGDEPSGDLDLGAIAALLRDHLAAEDPLFAYADRLADPALEGVLRGYLTGSLDLVVRVRDPEGDRFAILDYKTNWLAPPGEPPSAWHHRPSALAAAMRAAHYPLQALLYAVALHRYLRWRMPIGRPGGQLAAVLYLFVRGMSGPDTPRVGGSPCGVFGWRPPPGLVAALSDLLDRGKASG